MNNPNIQNTNNSTAKAADQTQSAASNKPASARVEPTLSPSTPAPAKDADKTLSPAKGNDEVMSQPAKQS